ncbi:multicopper oxidase domain-containing protein [Tomitella gaofuii]|uniref:multicopper oxidase domain-containing protein n=1 Tax=Tomitella gaofuii TaxID=2760083 RepID=UPI002E2C8854|nr:multicopper oxidase domain-containing protein [Tomitella gaofuii]
MSTTDAQPGRPRRPRSWHQRAGMPVRVWLVLLVLAGVLHRFLPESRWLLVHMFTLGAVTNSILVWSQHFTERFLRGEVSPRTRRLQLARIYTLNAAIVVTIVGVAGGIWPVTLAGSVLVGAVVAWHAVGLLRQLCAARAGGTAWHADGVWFYICSALLLPVGAGFGAALASGLSDVWHVRLILAHEATNLLGFLGLAAAGTLIVVYPRMLGIDDDATSGGTLRRTLPTLAALLCGLAAIVAGSLAGIAPLAAAGTVLYLLGWAAVAAPTVVRAFRTPGVRLRPWYDALSVSAALLWLGGSLIALAVIIATGPLAPARLAPLTIPLVAGFAAQLLLGVMSRLLPSLMGSGGTVTDIGVQAMNRWAVWRIVVINGGLLLWLLPLPSWARVALSALVMAAFVAFLPIMIVSARRAMAARRAIAAGGRPTAPMPAGPMAQRGSGTQITAALACLGLVVAVGAAISGPGQTASPDQGITATGNTTRVEVTAADMRFTPSDITVPAGDRLVITVTNTDDMVHDLVLDTGASSGRLNPGETATVDVGVVGRTVDGWCSIVGHRQQGMTLTITPIGGAGTENASAGKAGNTDRSAMGHRDAAGDPLTPDDAARSLHTPLPGDFRAADPVVAPAPPGTVHRYTFDITEQRGGVAPGISQMLWTYNGTVGGPTLRGRLGDTFEITLVNHGTMGHSIDFHAGMVSPDAPMRTINPGESLVYRFTAEHTGAWLYHCSTAPMSDHIAAGMFGAVIIDPPGLAPVDAEYLFEQSEVYLGPEGGKVDHAKVAAKTPDFVVFNGFADQYVARPLHAKVGDRIRIWVVDAGPNLPSAFHVVGTQFDTVYKEGAYLLRPDNSLHGGAQVLDLSPAQGGFVEMTFTEPGTYSFVDHVMSDAERGARGRIVVTE